MHEILQAALSDRTIFDAAETFSRRGEFLIYGVTGTQKFVTFAAAFAKNPRPTVILVSGQEKISAWKSDLSVLLPTAEIFELPELNLATVKASATGIERTARRLEIFARLMRGEKIIVFATAAAAVKKDFSQKDFLKFQFRVESGQNFSQEKFFQKLMELGYERTDEVDALGQFSVRGGIVDIFAINARKPCRIEFFDETIDSIREFNLETKRSEKNISSAVFLPIQKSSPDKAEPFFTCLGKDGTVVFDEPVRIREMTLALVRENPEVKKNIFSFETLVKNARTGSLIHFELMLKKIRSLEVSESFGITAANMTSFQGQTDFFVDEISRLWERKQKIFFLMSGESKIDEVKNLLKGKVPTNELNFLVGTLGEGFYFLSANLAVITERDIFGKQKPVRRKRTSDPNAGERIKHFRDIRPGDYVVHVTNGIGKYLGVETLEFNGIHRDYLNIQYAGEDRLYIPTDQVQFLQKYISDNEAVPRLSKLNSGDWTRAKKRAAASAEDIAKKLLDIYARRENAEGFAFPEDDESQLEFEAVFPYEETPDQLRAIAEIKKDMELPRPMDRLICGDVGFGKTEIAIRAAYKAAMSGKQVAVLVPTTVLAQQHYQTFCERFRGFLPTVDVICRFRSAKEQRITLQKVRAGQIDILIGTHAILNSNKIQFKNLGLLIIDEEQRFGVKQKEKIRDLSSGVDVLTLSATPIPRTLHMSLVGARDMSLIETPPAERFPVQTYVIEDDDTILSEAIRREIRRGGQIYFVYNRIETIDLIRERLEELVPEAKIQTAHGQMSDDLLESVMMDFYEGRFNLLLCTTIIENGLDVTNANTIIVYDADNFGLAQLYQMRGRVGRSHKMAFAYFVHRETKVLTETAERRLQAMKEFAQLGAGFKIAMRDLEIRGAGNLLGAQQHGNIAGVGFEMYCQLLEEAVSKLQNRPQEIAEPDPIINFSTEAYISDKYISDSMHKIEIYQRLAVMNDEKEIDDLLDEIIDRFGEPPESVINLLEISKIKCLAKKLKLKSLQEKNLSVEILFDSLEKISPKGFVELKKLFKNRLKDNPRTKTILIKLDSRKNLLRLVYKVLIKLLHK